MRVANVHVRTFSVNELRIAWEVETFFPAVGVSWDFRVLRSRNPTGEFMDISGPLPYDAAEFVDTSFRRYGPHRDFYYAVIIVPSVGEAARYPKSGGVRLKVEPDLVALEMARTEAVTLKSHKGRKCILFQKRHSGARCAECFNRVQNTRTKSTCRSCYNTGFMSGFYPPSFTYVQIVTPRDSTIQTQAGKVPVRQTLGKFPNFPPLREGDLVVEPENVRWLVGNNITPIAFNRTTIRQEVALVQIDESCIEFQVPVAEEVWSSWFGTTEKSLKNRTDLFPESSTESTSKRALAREETP